MALSSAEAEFYSATKAAAEALGAKSLSSDLGWVLEVEIKVDSNAARAMASRQGLVRTRHLEVRHLWPQEATEKRYLVINRVKGAINPADVFTELKNFVGASALLKLVNM